MAAAKPDVLKTYEAVKGKMFNILDDNGKLINEKWLPDLSDERVLEAYKFMQYARTADLMAVSYQRQGRMYTYPPNLGQEAISAGAGFVMRDQDWLVPAYRELGAWLLKGATMKDVFLMWGGNEIGATFSDSPNFLPPSVPIASQLLHAAGIGFALKYQEKPGVVFAFVGDGGTSEGDFHEALNYAGVWKAPVVFIIQNNQYAISIPTRKQTASRSLAIKALAYGIQGIQVDGNDFLAVYRAASEAAAHAESGKGPVLIEAVTYRKGAHTTSDDPSLYREKEEEEAWAKKDPILRLGNYLAAKKLWDLKDEDALIDEYRKEVDAQFTEYENHPDYHLKDVFQYMYKDLPDHLRKQQMDYEKFQNWEGGQK